MLDRKLICHLSNARRSTVAALHIFQRTDSTNQRLLTSVPDDVGGFHLCFAQEQTRGRGRHGHLWHSPEGGIYCSVLSRCKASSGVWLSLMVAVAVVNGLRNLGMSGIGVKWPNDIYCRFGKIGGVLVEYRGNVAVAGVGINQARPPQKEEGAGLEQLSTDLPDYQYLAAMAAEAIMQGFEDIAQYNAGVLSERYNQVDFLRGKSINVLPGDGSLIAGIACGITKQAHLRVRHDNTVAVYRAADVSIRLS